MGPLIYCVDRPIFQDGAIMPFRYSCTPRSKVNVFEPRALDGSINLLSCRYSQMGAALGGHFRKLGGHTLCKILWEVT